MKFVCNNCGFTAEIPDRRVVCPMCGSNNVSTNATTSFSGVSRQSGNGETQSNANLKTVEGNEILEKPQRITLTDSFFDAKPDKQQELADVLKELYPDSPPMTKKQKRPFNVKKTLLFAAFFVFLGLGIVFALTFKHDDKPKKSDRIVVRVKERNEDEEEEDISNDSAVSEEGERAVKAADLAENGRKSPKKSGTEPQIDKTKAVQKTDSAKRDLYDSHIAAAHKLLNEKKFQDALVKYKEASQLMPEEGSVYKFIGITYAYMQNQKEACINYKKYIQRSPNASDRAQVENFLKACD